MQQFTSKTGRVEQAFSVILNFDLFVPDLPPPASSNAQKVRFILQSFQRKRHCPFSQPGFITLSCSSKFIKIINVILANGQCF